MIQIVLVDDQALLCEVLKTWLEVEDDFEVIGTGRDGNQAIELVEQLQPDILLIDVEMPGMNGLDATKIITESYPEVKVIVLSGHEDDTYLAKSLKAGAKGFLLKNTTAEELATTIRSVQSGQNLIDPSQFQYSQADLMAFQMRLKKTMEQQQQQWQTQLEQLKQSINQTESNYRSEVELRLEKLANKTESNLKVSYEAIANIEQQLLETNHKLTQQLTRQVESCKQELQDQLDSDLKGWIETQERFQPTIEDFETKYNQELICVLNPLRNTIRSLDQQIQSLRNGMIISIVTSAISLSFAGWVFVNFNRSNNVTNLTPIHPENVTVSQE